jgi:hypothetical protein
MPNVSSTAIQRIDYDAVSRHLWITFVAGNVYKYYDVPRGIYECFVRASSKGVFFNENIKDRYDFAQTLRVS